MSIGSTVQRKNNESNRTVRLSPTTFYFLIFYIMNHQKLFLYILPIILISGCSQGPDTAQINTTGSVKIITGSAEVPCPPGMYSDLSGVCHTSPTPCPEWQTMTGTTGKEYCSLAPLNWKIDLWSGFTLSQNDKETTITYNDKTVRTWLIPDTSKVPVIYDNECIDILWKDYPRLREGVTTPEQQKIWDQLSQEKRIMCLNKVLSQKISIEALTPRFFSIIESHYEWAESDLFDASSWNILFHINGGTADNISIENNLLYVLRNGAYSENEIYTYSFTEKRVTKVLTEKGISKKGETLDNSEYTAALERFKNQSK